MRVSHETIYRSLSLQVRGVLAKTLIRQLRIRRTMRRAKRYTIADQTHGRTRNAISIYERLAEVATRKTAGHWESDLLTGAADTHIATPVERRSRYVLLVKRAGKQADYVIPDALAAMRRRGEARFSSVS